MALSPLEQAGVLLKTSQSPVIIIPSPATFDALAAGLALHETLQLLGKQSTIVGPTPNQKHASLLLRTNDIRPTLENVRTMMIDVDTTDAPLESLRYEQRNGHLYIFLATKNGVLRPDHVRPAPNPYRHDAIITIAAESQDRIVNNFPSFSDFFLHTPTINIDINPANTRFGHIALVDLVATSYSEIVYQLIKGVQGDPISPALATDLLSGIVAATHMFRSHRVSPQALTIAAELMTAGGKRDEVIQALYQTTPVSTLRLWGQALLNIEASDDGLVVWSTLANSNGDGTAMTAAEKLSILEELLSASAGAAYVALFLDDQKTVEVYIAATSSRRLPPIAGLKLDAQGRMFGELQAPLADTKELVLKTLQGPTGA